MSTNRRSSDEHLSTALLAADEGGNQALTGSLFIVIVLITVGITFWASRNNRTASDYYAGGRIHRRPERFRRRG